MLTLRHHRTDVRDVRGWPLRAVLAALAAAALLTTPWLSPAAQAHGSAADPVSRNYGCWLRWGDDFQNPAMEQEDPMCWQAWQWNTNAMWNWNGLYLEGTGGNYQAFIPDGELCSAGHSGDGRYNSLDNPGPWKTTPESTNFTVDVYDQALHGSDYLKVYVSKQGYDPETQPLKWSDLELLTTTEKVPPASHYYANVSAPGRSGHHIVYTVWKASHADQIYFFCSDVTF